MPRGKRVLWIEDGARSEYHDLLTPIYVAGYDLTLATNVTDAIREISSPKIFDAVIFDIRLPPGSDPRWIELYNQHGANPAAARLGKELLVALFDPEARVPIKVEKPKWLQPQLCAVFSVEADEELCSAVKKLEVGRCAEKKSGGSRRQVVALIEELLAVGS